MPCEYTEETQRKKNTRRGKAETRVMHLQSQRCQTQTVITETKGGRVTGVGKEAEN